jgi:hypothetical protein
MSLFTRDKSLEKIREIEKIENELGVS